MTDFSTRLLVRAGLLAGAAALSLGTAALPAQAAPAIAQAPGRPYCDPGTTYKLDKDQGWSWYAFDSGTVSNSSKKATIHKSISHSTNESKSTTKSGEVGLSVKAWVVEINAKYGYSVSKTVSYTTTTTFVVDVPPKSKVTYKDGIIVRKFRVKIVHLYDNCESKTTYGTVKASDNYSTVKDA